MDSTTRRCERRISIAWHRTAPGSPPEVVTRLSSVFVEVLADAGIVQRLAGAGLEPVGGTPEAFAARIRNEVGAWARAARDLGLSAN